MLTSNFSLLTRTANGSLSRWHFSTLRMKKLNEKCYVSVTFTMWMKNALIAYIFLVFPHNNLTYRLLPSKDDGNAHSGIHGFRDPRKIPPEIPGIHV